MLRDGDVVKNYDYLSICSSLLLIIASIDLEFYHGYVKKDSSRGCVKVLDNMLNTCV